MAVGDQDRGRVAVTVAAPLAGGILQGLDLLGGEISLGRSWVFGRRRGVTVRFTMVDRSRSVLRFPTANTPL